MPVPFRILYALLSVLMFAMPTNQVTPDCAAVKNLYQARNCYHNRTDSLCKLLSLSMTQGCEFYVCTKGNSKTEQCIANVTVCPQLFVAAPMGSCGVEEVCCSSTATKCEDFPIVETPSVFIHHQLGFLVLCDDSWTVFQWRTSGVQSFDMTYADYENGFGSRETGYWLGLKHIYALLQRGTHELYIEFNLGNGTRFHLLYNKFSIGPSSDGYRLHISHSDYNAIASNVDGSDLEALNGMKFTTKDRDQDQCLLCNCAIPGKGGWWYQACGKVNLNGRWNFGFFNWGTTWQSVSGINHPLSFTAMFMRLVQGGLAGPPP